MASYDSVEGVTTVIDDALAGGSITESTANAIKEIVESLNTSGEFKADSVTQVTETITQDNVAQVVGEASVVLMDKTASAEVKFDDTANVQAMVVGGGGGSKVEFATTKPVTVQLQGGENDSVSTGSGEDAITFAGGTATIDTGAGNDTVILQGGESGGEVHVKSPEGQLSVNIDFDLATTNVKATIEAGDGFGEVSVGGGRAGHFFEFVGNVFRMVKRAVTGQSDDGIMPLAEDDVVAQAGETGGQIDMNGVNVVTFTGANNQIADITVLADTAGEATVGRIYKFAFGREAIDVDANADTNIGGIQWWLDTYGASKDMDAAALNEMSYAMVGSSEFAEKYGEMSAQEFADAMFKNINDVATNTITTIDGMTAAQYAAAIESGQKSMEDVAVQIANSDEAILATQESQAGQDQYMIVSNGIA